MLRKTIFILFIFPDVLCKCPNGTFEYQSNCYLFNNTETGFAAAEVYCNGMNGHLVSIHDAFVNAIVILKEAKIYFHGSSDTDFWIGANNLISKSKWNWTDGTNFDFTDWNKGEPKNVTGSNCAALSVIDGIWSAQDCFKLKPFVCKILPTADSPVYKNCTIGWFYFAPTDSCYGVSAKGFVGNWTASEGYCEKLGAFLPSFNSFAEYQLVTSTIQKVY
uniref:C-type lectin domain-containing protein n=1 Tax=Panagrolaimus sp. ES5 TaxID=591445 RepID=A0AC34GTW2_9BILA